MKFYKKILSITIAIFLLSPYVVLASYTDYVWSGMEDISIATSGTPFEDSINDTSNPLNLNCESCILIEQNSGQVLYSYNSHKKLRPASVTKIMSILLIMDAISSGQISYDTKIPCSENAASMGGSQIWLDTTETLTVNDMIKAICVVSANDCVTAMAEYLGGTESKFVDMMNKKAQELGMKDTTFKNCHGIDEDGHVTSSYDISLMSKELLNKYPEITKYTTIWNDSLRNGKSELVNTNKLVRNYNGCTGLKTGSTSLALFNLSASATRDNLSLIAVVMKAPTSALRFSNASALLDYGFKNFQYTSLGKKGDIVQEIRVEKGTSSKLNAILENDVGALVSKGNDININKKITINNSIPAPISKGDIIGNVEFTLNDKTISSVNLIATEDISKLNFLTMSNEVLGKWFNLLRT